MPPLIKAILTVLVIVAATLLWTWRASIGLAAPGWLVFGLVALMVLGLWLFPEVKKSPRGPNR